MAYPAFTDPEYNNFARNLPNFNNVGASTGGAPLSGPYSGKPPMTKPKTTNAVAAVQTANDGTSQVPVAMVRPALSESANGGAPTPYYGSEGGATAPPQQQADAFAGGGYGTGANYGGVGTGDRQGDMQALLSLPAAGPAGAASPWTGSGDMEDKSTRTMAAESGAGNGVSKFVDGQGRVTYTNMGRAGYDDLQTGRGPGNALASVPGFLKGVKNIGSFSPPAAQPSADSATAALPTLDPRIEGLLNSDSITDNWRGRQLMKAHERQAGIVAALANARSGARTADAHVLTAGQNLGIQQMHNQTAMRGQDAGFAVHAPTVQSQSLALKAMAAGDKETADDYGKLFSPRYAPNDPLPKFSIGPDGSIVSATAGGIEQKTAAELKAEADKRAKNKAAGMIAPAGR